MDIQATLTRLEKCTGPDRELDAEITRTLGFTVSRDPERPADTRNYFEPTPGHSWEECWRYTASLDAALTLVPEGWRWKCAERIAGDFVGTVIERQQMEPVEHDVKPSEREARASSNVRYGIASTPPLALCIAALKSRQTL